VRHIDKSIVLSMEAVMIHAVLHRILKTADAGLLLHGSG